VRENELAQLMTNKQKKKKKPTFARVAPSFVDEQKDGLVLVQRRFDCVLPRDPVDVVTVT
jgi:hypothetical protein